MSIVDVLLVLRACVEHYPPTLNQANILVASGLRVGLIDLSCLASSNGDLNPDIQRWQVHRLWDSKTEKPLPLMQRWKNGIKFRRSCQETIRSTRPKVVIGYDISGCAHLRPGGEGYRTVFHFHELPERETGMRLGTILAHIISVRASRKADLVVFPDHHRAREFQRLAGLAVPPKVAMNCPVKLAKVPVSPLSNYLSLSEGPVVCYLGSVGTDQGLVSAASSMRYWPANARWAIIGAASDAVRSLIMKAAQAAGAGHRVFFLGPKPHKEALALAAGATLGLSLIQPNYRNWLYSAGAINKRFEYMALGLPQVTNDGPGVSEIVTETGCGVCVDPYSAEAIGRAVKELLENPTRLGQLREKARACHLERFNYETEFSEVANWIAAQVHDTPLASKQQQIRVSTF
jgi:glycosyltransferase involved in cell wall biosynthesis